MWCLNRGEARRQHPGAAWNSPGHACQPEGAVAEFAALRVIRRRIQLGCEDSDHPRPVRWRAGRLQCSAKQRDPVGVDACDCSIDLAASRQRSVHEQFSIAEVICKAGRPPHRSSGAPRSRRGICSLPAARAPCTRASANRRRGRVRERFAVVDHRPTPGRLPSSAPTCKHRASCCVRVLRCGAGPRRAVRPNEPGSTCGASRSSRSGCRARLTRHAAAPQRPTRPLRA